MKNYRIETREREVAVKMTNGDVATKTQYLAIAWMATPKGKYAKEKSVWAYHFSTPEKRQEYIDNFLAKQKAFSDQKEAEKRTFIEAKRNLVNPFKVGDIFYDSWGYDQTNIDFYQIVEVGKKSVVIRPIGQKFLESAGFMCEYVAPVPDSFSGKEETKILQMLKNGTVYITSRHGWISKWENRERIYQSHYA